MATETIKCPSCGTEVPQDVENCPDCGAPISVIMNNDISGVPIDNSAAIDAMLRSASQFVEESESLGLEEFDVEEDGEGEDENNEDDEIYQKVELNELPPELSETQKGAIVSSGIINLTPENDAAKTAPPKKTRSKKKASPEKKPDSAPEDDNGGIEMPEPDESAATDDIPDLNITDTSGDISESDEATASTDETASEKSSKKQKKKKGKKAKNEEPMLFEVDENGTAVKGKKAKKKGKKEKAPKEPKKDKKKSSPLKSMIVAVIALAVGIGGGFFGKIFLFPDLPTPGCQSFAQKAVTAAVNEIDGAKELYIAEAYVKEGVFSTQCIFRAFTENEDNVLSEWFRVKIDNDTERTTVYFELTPDEYERLRNSESGEDRAKAAVLKSNQNELERYISEMKIGDGWSSANVSLINNNLHPYAEVVTTTTESAEIPEDTDEISEEALTEIPEEAE